MKNFTLAIAVLLVITGCQSTPNESKTVQTNAQENNIATNSYEQSKESYNTWLIKIQNSKRCRKLMEIHKQPAKIHLANMPRYRPLWEDQRQSGWLIEFLGKYKHS